MESQPHRTGILRLEALFHNPGPHSASSAELGDLLEEVDMGIEKERKPRCKSVHVHFLSVDHVLYISDAIGQGKSQFLDGRRTGFSDVIAADADGVPARDEFSAEFDGVADQANGRFGRTHKSLLRGKFLE